MEICIALNFPVFSKFSNSFASETNYLHFFFPQNILRELLGSLALPFLLYKLQRFNYLLRICTLLSCHFKLSSGKPVSVFLVKLVPVSLAISLISSELSVVSCSLPYLSTALLYLCYLKMLTNKQTLFI